MIVLPIAFAGPLEASAGPDGGIWAGGDGASFPAAATACSCLPLWARCRGAPAVVATSPPRGLRVCGQCGRRQLDGVRFTDAAAVGGGTCTGATSLEH